MESAVLRALCDATSDSVFRARCVELLSAYRFLEPEHQVVFDALRRLPRSDAQVLRERLTLLLNNGGFPDVNLAPLFEPTRLSTEAVLDLIRDLASTEKNP